MKISLSCDDACSSDVRVAELANKYNVKCTFYIPVEWHSLAHYKGYEPLSYKDALDISKKHEIGSHGITHAYLTQIPRHQAYYEVENSKSMLENLFKTTIKKFAPPRGYTNELITEFTKRFYEKQRLTKADNLVHVHPNSGANDNKPWREAITDKTTEVWFHSWELDKYNLWEELEEWLKSIS